MFVTTLSIDALNGEKFKCACGNNVFAVFDPKQIYCIKCGNGFDTSDEDDIAAIAMQVFSL